jgi:hypothetical protein
LNGYSISEKEMDADLVLIDPFDALLSDEAPTFLRKSSTEVAIIAFVLIHDPNDADARRRRDWRRRNQRGATAERTLITAAFAANSLAPIMASPAITINREARSRPLVREQCL